jgi:hypothetical protein
MASAEYWVNDEALLNGTHEIHDNACVRLPLEARRTSLGVHIDCRNAPEHARMSYDQVSGYPTFIPT